MVYWQQLLKLHKFYKEYTILFSGILNNTDIFIFLVGLFGFIPLGCWLRSKRGIKIFTNDSLLSDLLKGITITTIAIILWAVFFDKEYFIAMISNGNAPILFPIAFIAALMMLINDFWKTGKN